MFLATGVAPAGAATPSLPAVVSGSTSWQLRDSLTSGPPTTTFGLGTRPVVPFTGDWDGNGSETPGTYSGGVLRLYDQIPPEASPTAITFGDPRGFPVAGDFDGDGRDDVAIHRNATWQIRFADDAATSTVGFGAGAWPATVPVAGDWDGNGTDGIGTYTLASGTWNLRQTASSGAPDAGTFVFWTGTGSYAVVGDWDANGTDTAGVKNGVNWSLNNQTDSGPPDVTFAYGVANDLPLTWKPAAASPTVATPNIFLGFADTLHAPSAAFVPSPWQGDPGVTFLGCTAGALECGGSYDAGAIRLDNPAANPTLTLVEAYVDIGPCHFEPWDVFLPATVGSGGTLILTQTGILGPPQPAPCDGRLPLVDRPFFNFLTNMGPFDTLDPPFSNCDPDDAKVPPPVITLVFAGGMTLTVVDDPDPDPTVENDEILSTGGVHQFACEGVESGTPWTPVPAGNIARTG
ncbi:MAG: hypothetical protein Q8K79_10915 [Solirubrobacteraceae bacterium]|nr:hypothetical protein [Solirubrobacteraceae bacterium]